MRLDNQHVVVTGAGRGIGRALALALARNGARITCLDIDPGSAGETAQLIRAEGGSASAARCDVTDLPDVERTLAAAEADLGPVSALVANAGGAAGERTPFLDLTPDLWRAMLDRNLTGAFHCGLAYGRLFAKRGQGAIVFTASTISEVASPGLAHYASAKGGVKQLMRGMALELAPYNVRVNAIAPGAILTPGNQAIIDTPQGRDQFRAMVPLQRVGQADELAGAVMYLISDEASYTTGATIVIDGGLTLQ